MAAGINRRQIGRHRESPNPASPFTNPATGYAVAHPKIRRSPSAVGISEKNISPTTVNRPANPWPPLASPIRCWWEKVVASKDVGGLRLRDLNIMNQVCVMKLGSKIINGDDDLWCQILRGKYRVEKNDNSLEAKSYDSKLWKAIVGITNLLSSTSIWNIGDGTKIHAWQDNWVLKGRSIMDEKILIPSEFKDFRVSDLVGNHGDWNWDLMDWIPQDINNRIAGIHPPLRDDSDDNFIIATEDDGSFKIGSMYRLLTEDRGYFENKDWKYIWKLHVPERVKCFIWLLNHDRLLTGYRMSLHGFGPASCPVCGNVSESTLHALRDCKYAMEVWANRIPVRILGNFFTTDLHEWIKLNVQVAVHGEIVWCSYWAIGCHSIWEWRNKESHDRKFVRPFKPQEHIDFRVREYKAATAIKSKVLECGKVEKLIQWHKPKESFVKVNVDGAHDGNDKSGCGGIIRDEHGNWHGGFSKNIGFCNPLMAELWGIFEGIKLVNAKGYKKIIIETDSSNAVELIHGKNKKKQKLIGNLMSQILYLMGNLEAVEVIHTHRDSNGCAHLLASHGKKLTGGCEFFRIFLFGLRRLLKRIEMALLFLGL